VCQTLSGRRVHVTPVPRLSKCRINRRSDSSRFECSVPCKSRFCSNPCVCIPDLAFLGPRARMPSLVGPVSGPIAGFPESSAPTPAAEPQTCSWFGLAHASTRHCRRARPPHSPWDVYRTCFRVSRGPAACMHPAVSADCCNFPPLHRPRPKPWWSGPAALQSQSRFLARPLAQSRGPRESWRRNAGAHSFGRHRTQCGSVQPNLCRSAGGAVCASAVRVALDLNLRTPFDDIRRETEE